MRIGELLRVHSCSLHFLKKRGDDIQQIHALRRMGGQPPFPTAAVRLRVPMAGSVCLCTTTINTCWPLYYTSNYTRLSHPPSYPLPQTITARRRAGREEGRYLVGLGCTACNVRFDAVRGPESCCGSRELFLVDCPMRFRRIFLCLHSTVCKHPSIPPCCKIRRAVKTRHLQSREIISGLSWDVKQKRKLSAIICAK